MQYSTSNKLSYSAIGELLKLLTLLCPSDNALPKTFYSFKKFFQQFSQQHTLKQVCLTCVNADACSCENPTSSANVAHLVKIEIHKPLRTIISSTVLQTQTVFFFVFLAFLSVYVCISLSTGQRVLKLGKATDWTSRSTVIGRIYFDDEN
jgi:hypothetical protein